jgi:hypothetical protein
VTRAPTPPPSSESTVTGPLHPDVSRLTLPYRLRLGVTGHRQLDDPNAVATAVHQLLNHLEGTFRADGHVQLEWTIISALAKGADRIVADAVLTHSPEVHNPELEVITPLPLAEYRTDFETAADGNEFETLFLQRSSLTELHTEVAVAELRAHAVRNRCYLEGGKAMVRACEIVIALWDGAPAKGEGGTGDVVRYALDRGRVVLWIPVDGRSSEPWLLLPPPHWLPSALRRGPYRAVPLPTRPKRLSLGLHQLAAFLRDPIVPTERLRAVLTATQTSLQNPAGRAGLPHACLQPVFDHLTPYYVRADQSAAAYQARHTIAIKAVLYLTAIAVSSVAFQVLFVPAWHAPMAIEVLSMLGILIALAVNRQHAWHEKWVNDRYLAEHLRTASYALALGEDPSPLALGMADVMPFYAGPKSWLPAAIRNIVRVARPPSPTTDLHDPLKRFIVDAWLMEQSRWHAANAEQKARQSRRRRGIIVALFGTTLTVATLHLLGVGEGHVGSPFTSAEQWCTFLAIVLPAWATAIHAVGKQLEYERVAARSRQMARVLERLGLSAGRARTIEELRDVVREATQVVGLENHEWSVLLSFAPPELAL